jgi:myo-inositol 2-dehydrogenase/D-chiro-inositol 1-dehydrogenase
MAKHLRYGVIGCGSMGREHIENIQALPAADGGASVTAIADPHAPSREAALALCRDRPRVFDDPRDLLASGLCDAVVIATPNHTHAAVMRDALATDLPILV